MLATAEWSDFVKEYQNLSTEDGLVAFSQAECINPQRIPAVVVAQHDPVRNRYVPIANPTPGRPDPVCQSTKLYSLLGVQTDYSDGKGVLTPEMLASLMTEGRQVVATNPQ
jgi:hypothetical protein